MNIQNKKNIKYFYLLIVSLYSILINQYYGNLGFHILDSTIGLANGHRLNFNQIPFNDYWATSGFLTDIFQSIFFSILGNSWQVYVFHASVFNFLFVCSIFFFLRYLNFNNNLILIYCLSSATLMYPLSGVLLVDFHSLIICTLGLLLFIYSTLENNKKIIFLVPTIFVIGFLCKQIPAAYFILTIIVISLIYTHKYKTFWLIYYLSLGTIFALMSFALLLYFYKINLDNFIIQYIYFALSIFSNSQNESLLIQLKEAAKIKYLLMFFFLFYIRLIIEKFPKNKKDFLICISIVSFTLVIFLVEIFTNNQNVMLGIFPLLIALTSTQFIKLKSKSFNLLKYFFYLIIIIFSIRLIMINLNYSFLFLIAGTYFYIKKKKLVKFAHFFILINIIISTFYFEKFVKIRRFNDIFNPIVNYIDGDKINKKFLGLKWKSNIVDTEAEINKINFVLKIPIIKHDSTLIISNLQIYNFILDKESNSPVKYWMKNKSYPSKDSVYKNNFDKFFLNKIKKKSIKHIVLVDDTDLNLNNFLWLKKCLSFVNQNNVVKVFKIKKNCL